MSFSHTPELVWRDYVIDGNAGSGAHNPVKSEIRTLLREIINNAPLATTGAAGAYVVSTGQSLSALTDGQTFHIAPNHASPGASTLTIDGIAKAIKKVTGDATYSDLAENDLLSGASYLMRYSASADALVAALTSAAATAAELVSGDYRYTLDLASTADGELDDGVIRFNDATIADVTEVFMSDTEVGGADLSGIIDTWDDRGASTDRGVLMLRDRAAPTKYALFRVTGSVVADTGRRKLTVVHVASGGALADEADLNVSFDSGSIAALPLSANVAAKIVAFGRHHRRNGGSETSCFIDAAGQTWFAGAGANLANGRPDGADSNVWLKVPLPDGYTLHPDKLFRIGNGYAFIKLTNDDGATSRIYFLGNNDKGQGGVGDTVNRSEWTNVSALNGKNVVEIYTQPCDSDFADELCTLFRTDEATGNLYHTGTMAHGISGDGVDGGGSINTPAVVTGFAALTVVDVDLAGETEPHAIARLSDGTARTWGADGYAQCGAGGTAAARSPFDPGFSNVTDVACFGAHDRGGPSYGGSFLVSDGDAFGTGYNVAGELGLGVTGTPSTATTQVFTELLQLENVTVTKIRAAGGYLASAGALTDDGYLHLWGGNLTKELADGTTTNNSIPTQPSGAFQGSVADFAAVGGERHGGFQVKTTDGELWTSGYATNGEPGTNDTADVGSFTQVRLSGTLGDFGASGIYTGWTCHVLYSEGDADIWGSNAKGQGGAGLTAGTDLFRPQPVSRRTGEKGEAGGAGAGETNTASNIGTDGVGLFKEKSSVDLRFKKLNSLTDVLVLTDNVAEDQIDVEMTANVLPTPGILSNSDLTEIYISPPGLSFPQNLATLTADTKFFIPVDIPYDLDATHVAISVGTAGAAGKVARVGVRNYTTSGAGFGTFGSLLVDSGDIAVDATGVIEKSITVTIPKGRYVYEIVGDGAPQLYCQLRTFHAHPGFGMRATSNIPYPVLMVSRAFTYGALLPTESGTLTHDIDKTFWVGIRGTEAA